MDSSPLPPGEWLPGRKRGLRGLLAGFVVALGFGKKRLVEGANATDRPTRLAFHRTLLASARTYWAAERTLMSWIRTSLSMISFGFTIGKLGETIEAAEEKGLLGFTRTLGVDTVAYFLIALGTLALLAALVQYSQRVYLLAESSGLRPMPSIAFPVGVILTVAGALAFSALVLDL